MGKIKNIFYGFIGTIAVILAFGIYYSLSDDFSLVKILFLLAAVAILVMGTAVYISNKKKEVEEKGKLNSSIILESLHRVLKVVTAEGQFTEIVDFSHTSQKLSILSSTKKALIISKATVSMGYDFSKMEWDINEKDGSVKLVNIPEPHIISVSPDIRYYNIENGLFNRFDTEDLNMIQEQCVTQIKEVALQSNLPNLAASQVKVLLAEFAKLNKWKLSGVELLEQEQRTIG